MDNVLLEKWQPLVESKKAKPIKNVEAMTQLLENQEQWLLQEAGSTALADISQYTPILVPAVRRIFPNLLANDIVGVQPMTGPTGYAFAIRFGYETGKTGSAKNNLNGAVQYPNSINGSGNLVGTDRMQKPDQSFNSIALVLKGNVPTATGVGTFTFDADGAGAGAAVVYGDVVLAEYDKGQNVTKVLIQLTGNQSTADSLAVRTALKTATLGTTTITVGGAAQTLETATATLTANQTTVLAFFNNEAGFNLVFGTAYAPYMATSTAEYLDRTAMKSMKMSVERFAVTAETRKYKAEYSLELAQDLKNVHGLDAEAELINIMEYEVAAELDRDLVDIIHQNSTNAGSWFYGNPGQLMGKNSDLAGTPSQTADGRWELEKFRTLYTRIVREANAVALSTRRGSANFIIASLNVVSALETLSNFMYSAVPGNVEPQIGVAKVGTLDGRFTVYLDTFAFNDFFIVGYKGASAMDTGIVYCPYVPLQIIKVTDPNTFQPAIGFQSRDAIMGNLWGAEKYYRKVFCDFTGSSFISDQYYY
jgi:Major capsid protein Gp23